MSDQNIIARMSAAWSAIDRSKRKSWENRKAVGRGLVILRSAAMKAVGTNQPLGTRYNTEVRRLLAEHKLGTITPQERHKAIYCIEHEVEIEALRAKMPDAQRQRYNSPSALWGLHRRSLRPRRTRAKSDLPHVDETPIEPFIPLEGGDFTWPDEARRRVVLAIRNTRGETLQVMADAALRAAIRCIDDYRAMKPSTAAKPAPKSKPAAALELHA
jgi:hypothetical protein